MTFCILALLGIAIGIALYYFLPSDKNTTVSGSNSTSSSTISTAVHIIATFGAKNHKAHTTTVTTTTDDDTDSDSSES